MEESSTQEVSHHCVVPYWNQLPTTQRGQSLTHVQFQPSLTTSTPPFHFPQQMHIPTVVGAMHGADSNGVPLLPPMMMVPPLKPRWGSSNTLESIVREATLRNFSLPKPDDDRRSPLRSRTENHRKATRISGPMPPSQATPRKTSSVSERVRRRNTCLSSDTCASGSSTYNMREDDSNTMTTTELTEDGTSQEESGSKDEEGDRRGVAGRTSRFSRQSKGTATTTHSLSKRGRRVRINEKMKALQKMVPHSSKTDKASMLDEVILYMKQLQAQVEMMKLIRRNAIPAPDNDSVNVSRTMDSMMIMPPAALPPDQLQMSLLTQMGVGFELGKLSHANNAAANNAFVAPTVPQPQLPPLFIMPQMRPTATFTESHLNSNINGPLASMALHNPYAAFLAREISMDNYHKKLAALHQRRIRQHPIPSDKTPRQRN